MTKILVIEDEALIRENILELLEAEDFTVLSADNGSVGLVLAQESFPDLIVCDVMLPGLDGYGVLQAIRNNPETKMIPFVFMTALAERNQQRQGLDMGADDYITKPCTATELVKIIQKQLAKAQNNNSNTFPSNTTANNAGTVSTIGHQTRIQRVTTIHHASPATINLDSVTQLPNRLALRDRFHQVKQRVEMSANPAKPDAEEINPPHYQQLPKPNINLIPVFCLSLDRFSRISDTLGYDGSDLLLKSVGKRLVKLVGQQATVAHLNTNEFAIILEPISHKDLAVDLAKNILEQLASPFTIEEQEIFVTASLGIAVYPTDGNDIEKLLRHGKQTMNHVQHRGGNRYDFYLASNYVDHHGQLALETDLRYALERNQLQLYYQPKVNIATGLIVGSEALLRWQHQQKGWVSPGVFIPLAEETGLIELIGEWVLETACEQIITWQKQGLSATRVAVNISGRQFNQTDLQSKIASILTMKKLAPELLELEFTESILLESIQETIYKLGSLKELGLQIAIDDFGTGYSSLGYLQQFPFDNLKLDQCFVRNIDHNTTNQAITKAVISMAHQLQLKVVAEGVETFTELEFLRDQECDEIQGYLFSRPLAAPEFQKLVEVQKFHSMY
ncbi:MAG: EAL domain-containing response regulator [Microcoleaceae cyanobacterium]